MPPSWSCWQKRFAAKRVPERESDEKKKFVCKICGYVYEGEALPKDFVCPICKRGAEDFEEIK